MNPLNYYAKALADTLESHMQPCAFAVLVWNEVSVARVVGAKHVVVGELLNYQRKFGKKHFFQQNAFFGLVAFLVCPSSVFRSTQSQGFSDY